MFFCAYCESVCIVYCTHFCVFLNTLSLFLWSIHIQGLVCFEHAFFCSFVSSKSFINSYYFIPFLLASLCGSSSITISTLYTFQINLLSPLIFHFVLPPSSVHSKKEVWIYHSVVVCLYVCHHYLTLFFITHYYDDFYFPVCMYVSIHFLWLVRMNLHLKLFKFDSAHFPKYSNNIIIMRK